MSFSTFALAIKGLRQLAASQRNADGTYQARFLLPFPDKFECTEDIVTKELPGADVIADKSTAVKGLNITMGWNRIKLSQIAQFLGSAFTATGASPNTVLRYVRNAQNDVPPSFKLQARSAYVGHDYPAGDYITTVYRASIVSPPKTMQVTDEYYKVEVQMYAVIQDDGSLWECSANETGAALVEGSDSVPPTVSSITPAQGATGVSVSTTITIVFSEPIQFNAGDYSLAKIITSTNIVDVPLSAVPSVDKTTVTLTPNSNLSAASVHNVRISSNLKDAAGNFIAGAANYEFTTA
jgi:hypothetical protein